MRPLPFDHPRCIPVEPDSHCKNCKRWWDHVEQTLCPTGQSSVRTTGSRDEACAYIPISLQEKTK